MAVLLSSLYNAPIQYFSKLLLSEPSIIDPNEHYLKQTYRNRCIIYSADGMMTLSIPVNFSSTKKDRVKDVTISYQTHWDHVHWNAIVSAYNSTPFFEYYRSDYEAIYNKKYKYLVDLNNELLLTTIKFLRIQEFINLSFATEYIAADVENSDYRDLISPKKGQRDELFIPTEYYQVFSERFGFITNLSILDLLFNMGNESLLVLLNSINKKEL